jgi:hypothetical protein
MERVRLLKAPVVEATPIVKPRRAARVAHEDAGGMPVVRRKASGEPWRKRRTIETGESLS